MTTMTAETAFRIFTRPRLQEPSAAEQVLATTADTGRVPFRDGGLAWYGWGSGPLALLVHGWCGRATQFHALVPALVAQGHRVVAFDAPAHGASDGRQATVTDFGEAVLAVAAHHGPVDLLVGHSMGSPAALYAFARGLAVGRSVHVAGVASLVWAVGRLARALGLPPDDLPALRARIEDFIRAPLESMDLDVLRPGLRHPALLLHDPADAEVPYGDSRALAAAWPGAVLQPMPDAGHNRILRDPRTIAAVTGFTAPAVTDSAACARSR